MKRILYSTLLLILFSPSHLEGQDPDITIRGNFNDLPFTEFAWEVEQQSGATFFFLEEWVKGIRVTVSGDRVSLRRTLDRILLPAGLSYYLDMHLQVYLTNQAPLVSRLPDYSGTAETLLDSLARAKKDNLTSTEKRYIEGKRAGLLETLRVGDSEEVFGETNTVLHGKITDVETGEPLIGATIYIEELKKGAATDVDGRFSMVVKPGKYTVDFNCMGMESMRNYLEVYTSGDLSVSMEKSLISLTEVVIQASNVFTVSAKGPVEAYSNAVLPARSLRSTTAPFWIRFRTISVCPLKAASIRAVWPSISRALTLIPASRDFFTFSPSPSRAACRISSSAAGLFVLSDSAATDA